MANEDRCTPGLAGAAAERAGEATRWCGGVGVEAAVQDADRGATAPGATVAMDGAAALRPDIPCLAAALSIAAPSSMRPRTCPTFLVVVREAMLCVLLSQPSHSNFAHSSQRTVARSTSHS